jgi:acetyl-CoA acetyltransferase
VMPIRMPHDEVAACLGLPDYFGASASFYGSGIAGAHVLAAEAITSGRARVIVSYFGVDWGSRTGAAYGAAARGGAHSGDDPKEVFERPFGYYGQPYYFGAIATRYRHLFDVDLEEALGSVAVQFRHHALRNGRAQMTRPLDMDGYLASPYVAEPLRVADCCLLTDGAAATVMVSSDHASDLRNPPVEVAGAALKGAPLDLDRYFSQNRDFLGWPSARSAVNEALSKAGCTLSDLHFAELYDCFTMTVLMQLEAIGWCEPGEAPEFVRGGKRIAIEGDLPLNTHGGLLSHSYLLGISHIAEAIRQLRGEAGTGQVPGAAVGLVGLLAGPHYGALVLARR